MEARIVLLPGDGIGPEVVAQARRVLDVVAARFQHAFAHPPDRVWRVITDPEYLRAWFPARVELDLTPGESPVADLGALAIDRTNHSASHSHSDAVASESRQKVTP